MGLMAFRTRSTRTNWYTEPGEVRLFAQANPDWTPRRIGPSLIVTVKVAMPGGGKSVIATTIPPEEFANLARLMMGLDAGAAREAFDAAIREHARPPG